jgi:hypothetical protein
VAASVFAGLSNRGGAGRVSGTAAARPLGRSDWVLDTADGPVPVAEPWSRPVTDNSVAMGADNDTLG